MIEIKEVKNKRDLRKFVNFVLKLYKNCDLYVPMIYEDEMKLLSPKNGYIKKSCKHILFLAYKDNKLVGRIQGIIPIAVNEKNNQKRVRFTRFDCINDQEVANALFDAVGNYGKQNGMDTICGPLGYSDLEREGLLIEGFDQLGTYEEQYNYEYYHELLSNYGFVKEADWLEFQIRISDEQATKIMKYYDRIMSFNHLHVGEKLPKRKYIKKYKDGFFDLVDKCYKDLYGTADIDPDSKKYLLSSFWIFLNFNNFKGILNEKDELIGFGLWIPSLSNALRGTSGKLSNPINLIKVLHAIKHPKVYDFLLCGILPEYRNKGADIAYIKELYDLMKKYNLDHFETNLNLETNHQILAEWKRFDARQNKRRRAFVKEI